MQIDPNNAFKEDRHPVRMMTEDQRVIIERMCKKHNTSLITLTTKIFGQRKKTKDLTHLDAGRCIYILSAWGNLKKIGDVP